MLLIIGKQLAYAITLSQETNKNMLKHFFIFHFIIIMSELN